MQSEEEYYRDLLYLIRKKLMVDKEKFNFEIINEKIKLEKTLRKEKIKYIETVLDYFKTFD